MEGFPLEAFRLRVNGGIFPVNRGLVSGDVLRVHLRVVGGSKSSCSTPEPLVDSSGHTRGLTSPFNLARVSVDISNNNNYN